tara:strand:+ start:53 stop:199 length:147 start_codon:yes stop_codon:yes gene_type:complete
MPNKQAKQRKQQRNKLNTWLSVNGRTAKQYKKRQKRKSLTNKGTMYGK